VEVHGYEKKETIGYRVEWNQTTYHGQGLKRGYNMCERKSRFNDTTTTCGVALPRGIGSSTAGGRTRAGVV
jgi:hypothetical protein